jgi:hypothetical protein
VQAAKPNPTQATPIHKVITDKPIIKVPGCPPIAEVMTGVITYMLTFDRIPELDRQGRPKMFYSQRIHDKCYRRPHFDAGQFVEPGTTSARKGYCLYKVGCKGPTTYNACSTVRGTSGTSFPIKSGHGCIGCSEDGFWDKGSFYDRLTDIHQFGIEANADEVGGCGRRGRRGVAGARRRQRPQARQQEQSAHYLATIADAPATRQEHKHQWVLRNSGFNLDNTGRRIVVDPVTRIEGHMRVRGQPRREQRDPQRGVHRHHVARPGGHPQGPRPARRLGLRGAHLRRVHRHPRADLGARGGGRAGHPDPAERAPDPRT